MKTYLLEDELSRTGELDNTFLRESKLHDDKDDRTENGYMDSNLDMAHNILVILNDTNNRQ
jgi:hypothetical protein